MPDDPEPNPWGSPAPPPTRPPSRRLSPEDRAKAKVYGTRAAKWLAALLAILLAPLVWISAQDPPLPTRDPGASRPNAVSVQPKPGNTETGLSAWGPWQEIDTQGGIVSTDNRVILLDRLGAIKVSSWQVRFTSGRNGWRTATSSATVSGWQMRPDGALEVQSGTNSTTYRIMVNRPFIVEVNPTHLYVVDQDGQLWRLTIGQALRDRTTTP